MKIRTLAATAALTVGVLGVASGTAQAAPDSAGTPAIAPSIVQGVDWTVTRDGTDVVVHVASGSLAIENNLLIVRNGQGAVVASVPLTLAVDGLVHPVAARVAGDTAVLTTNTDPAAGTVDHTGALSDLARPAPIEAGPPSLSLTPAIGTSLGAATGLVGGCLLGAIAGAAMSAPAVMLFGAGPVAGCVGGALLLGSGSGLAGTATGDLGADATTGPHIMQLLNQAPAPKN
ncbi:hypothetical protein [Rhodococcus sp. NPDC057529]|uniref:hypothetical protein n=1 Tax=Rhodococcus sp. NPDC057529 TaxID=3346158 RepID=UPI00366C08C4